MLLTHGEFWRDDFQSQFLPAYIDMYRALREGSFPLLSPYSWFGGDLIGEYQYGVFSVVHLLIICFVCQWKLQLSHTAAAIVLIYVVILASGTFRLGRRLGLTVPNAMIATQAATLNGWLFYWGAQSWFAAFASFAWLPWAWWGLLVAMDQRYGQWRFLPAGVFLYLILAAGWPFTVLMAGIVTAWLSLRSDLHSESWTLWPIGAAWALGLALASPAILALLEYFHFTVRNKWGMFSVDTWTWNVPLRAFGGTIFPFMPALWMTWRGPSWHISYDLYAGFVPAVALLAAAIKFRIDFLRRYRWELGLLVFVMLLCHYGAVGSFRYSFRWLPLYHLLVGLLGAMAVQYWMTRSRVYISSDMKWRSIDRLGLYSLFFILVLGSYSLYTAPLVMKAEIKFIGRFLLSISLLWFAGDLLLSGRPAIRWLPVALMAVALIGTCIHSADVAQWHIREAIRTSGPFDSGKSYLAMLGLADIHGNYNEEGTGEINRFGNTPMYAGLSFVNGYSPQGPKVISKIFGMGWIGHISLDRGEHLLKVHTALGGLLELMGIDGIVLGREFMQYSKLLKMPTWELVANLPMGMVFHRLGPASPRVRSIAEVEYVASSNEVIKRLLNCQEGCVPRLLVASRNVEVGRPYSLAVASIDEIAENRLSVRGKVENRSQDQEALLVFSRAYYPGYRAFLNGNELPVEALNGLQPAVMIPPGAKGEFLLAFSPKSVWYGFGIALAGMLGSTVFLGGCAVMRRRNQ